jgi:hypothetical protein
LPDGRFIALERSFGTEDAHPALRGRPRRRHRGEQAAPARRRRRRDGAKHLLWQYASLNDNFEGIGIGPELKDGSRSVVLVSDDGHELCLDAVP